LQLITSLLQILHGIQKFLQLKCMGFITLPKIQEKTNGLINTKKRKIVFLKNCVVFFLNYTTKKKGLGHWYLGHFWPKNTPNNLATLY
jgi:hypothetical protein